MPDITMCDGFNLEKIECPLRDTCYRFKATPTPMRQAFFVDAPFTNDGCKHYWEDRDDSTNRRQHRT